MATWEISDAAHLLRRAGFGGSTPEVVSLHALGQEGAIASLLNYESIPDPAESQSYQFGLDLTRVSSVMLWVLYRMFASTRPLQERLTWFWHGHFTSNFAGALPALMVVQNETWRRSASGDFRSFLKVMYKDPAMLVFLDNNENVKGAPNENFAREVMELFTLGVGNYTETDIKEAARALTGWVVTRQNPNVGTFVSTRHDNGTKTILGQTGNFNGDQFMDILASHAVTPRFVSTRLYQHFVRPTPAAGDIDTLVASWQSSGGSIKAVMNSLLHLDSFWAPETRFALVKSPIEFVLGLAQRFQISPSGTARQTLFRGLSAMGQEPLNPPDVAGYPKDLEWTGTSALLARYNTANQVLYARDSDAIVGLMTQGLSNPSAQTLVDTLIERMGPLAPTAVTYQALLDYAGSGFTGTAAQVATKTRGLLHLITSSPEYHLN